MGTDKLEEIRRGASDAVKLDEWDKNVWGEITQVFERNGLKVSLEGLQFRIIQPTDVLPAKDTNPKGATPSPEPDDPNCIKMCFTIPGIGIVCQWVCMPTPTAFVRPTATVANIATPT